MPERIHKSVAFYNDDGSFRWGYNLVSSEQNPTPRKIEIDTEGALKGVFDNANAISTARYSEAENEKAQAIAERDSAVSDKERAISEKEALAAELTSEREKLAVEPKA